MTTGPLGGKQGMTSHKLGQNGGKVEITDVTVASGWSELFNDHNTNECGFEGTEQGVNTVLHTLSACSVFCRIQDSPRDLEPHGWAQGRGCIEWRTVQVVGMVRKTWELRDESVGKLPEGHGG